METDTLNKTWTFILLGTLLYIASCTKDKGLIPAEYEPNHQGVFSLIETYTLVAGTQSLTARSATARFATINNTSKYPYADATVNSVYLNNKNLPLYSPYSELYMYSDNIGAMPIPPATWKVEGNTHVPSINETVHDSFPKFLSYNSLPDSISKSATSTLTINVLHADSFSVVISDGVNIYGPLWGAKVPATTSLVTVSSPTFLALSNSATLSVTNTKTTTRNLSKMNFYFKTQTRFQKTIKIVP
jgi:hypothetical protein